MCRTIGAIRRRGRPARSRARRERPPGARHLGAARLGANTSGSRSSGAPRSRSGSGSAARARRGRSSSGCGRSSARPTAAPPEVRGEQLGAPRRRAGSSARAARTPRGAPSRGAARRPSARRPSGAGVERCRSIGVPSTRSAERRRSVAEVLTTSRSPGAEEVGQVAEAGVHERAVVAVGDEHPHVVSRAAGGRGLRRLVGLRRRGPKARGVAHGAPPRSGDVGARGSGRSAGRPRRAPAGRARCPRAAGRSEMSSPGKASCCICVLMSPGSTA